MHMDKIVNEVNSSQLFANLLKDNGNLKVWIWASSIFVKDSLNSSNVEKIVMHHNTISLDVIRASEKSLPPSILKSLNSNLEKIN